MRLVKNENIMTLKGLHKTLQNYMKNNPLCLPNNAALFMNKIFLDFSPILRLYNSYICFPFFLFNKTRLPTNQL